MLAATPPTRTLMVPCAVWHGVHPPCAVHRFCRLVVTPFRCRVWFLGVVFRNSRETLILCRCFDPEEQNDVVLVVPDGDYLSGAVCRWRSHHEGAAAELVVAMSPEVCLLFLNVGFSQAA